MLPGYISLNRHIRTENQIDHTCTARQFRRNLQNVKVKIWVNAASDQQLLLAKVKLIKKQIWKSRKMPEELEDTLTAI